MKKYINTILFVVFVVVLSSTTAFSKEPVPTRVVTPSHVYSYKPTATATDPVNMQAQINELQKKVRGLEEADKTLWAKIFGKKKGALVALEGRLQSMIKTAIDGNTTNAASIQKLIDNDVKIEKEVTDLKNELPTMLKKAVEEGVKGFATKEQVESMRTFGQWAFFCIALAIVGLFILSYRRKS